MLEAMLSLVLMLAAQDAAVGSAEGSRAEELERARYAKAANVEKPTRTFLENALIQFKERRVMERFAEGIHGVHPIVGGIRSGSGFGGGAFVETETVRASGQVSLNGYQKYELRFTAPAVFGERFFADFRATYRDFPQERFYGLGENSSKDDETSFRLEDTNYVGRFGFSPAKRVKTGVLAGWLRTNVGSGTYRRSPSIETVFDASALPALSHQPNYFQVGAFFEADLRDEPGNPRAGGRYTASFTSYQDRKLSLYGFRQYDAEAQQYIPFFHRRRVIALRAKTTLTQTPAGQTVPFFMQPSLGGSEDLRGYREYRFRDRNMVVLNAEYRWEAFSGLDLAAFADAGQVAATAGDLHFGSFKKAYGAGFRFNTARSVFLRMDVGFSKEGRHVFVKFGHVF